MSLSHFSWPIVGNRPIIDFLKKSISDDFLAHAYLFYGPAHLGKTLTADFFVKSLFCKSDRNKPCGECAACRSIADGVHSEVSVIELGTDEKTGKQKKNISIAQVRTLVDKLNLHSFDDSYKVGIIRQADKLSLEAANAMLKTLEEPSGKTILILVADAIRYLPSTLQSRCFKLKFLPVSQQEIVEYLISEKFDSKKANQLAKLSYGRPGVAIDFMSDHDLYNQYLHIIKEIASLPEQTLDRRFSLLTQSNLVETRSDVFEYLNLTERVWRDVLLLQVGNVGLVVNTLIGEQLEQLAARYTMAEILRIINFIKTTKKYISANVNSRLALENLVLNY